VNGDSFDNGVICVQKNLMEKLNFKHIVVGKRTLTFRRFKVFLSIQNLQSLTAQMDHRFL